MTAAGIVGSREAVDAYFATPAGRTTAHEMAEAIYGDPERLAMWEAGLDGDDLHPTVEAALNRLVAARNGRERT